MVNFGALWTILEHFRAFWIMLGHFGEFGSISQEFQAPIVRATSSHSKHEHVCPRIWHMLQDLVDSEFVIEADS